MAIDQARALHREWNRVFDDPANQIGQQVAMVRQIISRETPVQVRWQKRDPPSGRSRVQNQPGPIGFRLSHPGGFRRVNRERWHKSQRHRCTWVHLEVLKDPAEGEKVSILKSVEGRVALAGRKRFLAGSRTIDLRTELGVPSRPSWLHLAYVVTGWCFLMKSGSISTPTPGPVGTLIFPPDTLSGEVLHSKRTWVSNPLNS